MTHPERVNKSRPQSVKKSSSLRRRWLIVSCIDLVAVAASVFVDMAVIQDSGSDDAPLAPIAATVGHDPYPLVEADDLGWVRLPVSTFDDYAAHYYTYMLEDQPILLSVLKSTDGVVRSAFNACNVCYLSLKGYSQDGQTMICNNCESQFPADQINVVRGGCNPSPLERPVEEEDLVIYAEDIIVGAIYF